MFLEPFWLLASSSLTNCSCRRPALAIYQVPRLLFLKPCRYHRYIHFLRDSLCWTPHSSHLNSALLFPFNLTCRGLSFRDFEISSSILDLSKIFILMSVSPRPISLRLVHTDQAPCQNFLKNFLSTTCVTNLPLLKRLLSSPHLSQPHKSHPGHSPIEKCG